MGTNAEQHYEDQRNEVDRVRGWHVDRTIPLVLIFMILVQTAGAFWWASNISSRVEAAERTITLTTTDLSANNMRDGDQQDRIVRLETIGISVSDKLNQILNAVKDK